MLPAEIPKGATSGVRKLVRKSGANTREILRELQERTKNDKRRLDEDSTARTAPEHFAKTMTNRIEILAVWDELLKYEREVREEFKDRFPTDIPHVTRLPDDVVH